MKWFKHYSDNHRGQSVNHFLDELGYFGPFLYYTIYELCAEKLEKEHDRDVTCADCQFRFHRRVVCSATRAKPSTVVSGLDVGQSCGLWSYKTDGDYFEIKIPILLDLLESDQKKTRSKRDQNATKTRLEVEIEIEIEKDICKATAVADSPPHKQESDVKLEDSRIKPQDIFDLFNRLDVAMPKVKVLSDARKKKLGLFLKDVKTLQEWEDIFLKASEKGFTGVDGKEFVPSFDYVLEKGRHIKLLEEARAASTKEVFELATYENYKAKGYSDCNAEWAEWIRVENENN